MNVTNPFLFGIFLCIVFNLELSSSAIVIATWDKSFEKAAGKAAEVLGNGKSCLDAVETACRTCEELQCDRTVGYGGSPDEAAETTLDAMIMDGTTMNIGAVGALRRVKNAIGVARKVLENTKHTFLVGEQASQFALRMGFKEESLITNESKVMYKSWIEKHCQPNFWINVKPDPSKNCGPYKPTNFIKRTVDSSMAVSQTNHDTIGVVAIDKEGKIAAGTSTNGASHKIPGRVGDSPIPGSGAYVTQGIGGAAATGDGDVMMRFLPSLLAVEGLQQGLNPEQSAKQAIQRIVQYYPNFSGAVVVLAQNGSYAAACNNMKEGFPFSIGKADNGTFTTYVEKVTCS